MGKNKQDRIAKRLSEELAKHGAAIHKLVRGCFDKPSAEKHNALLRQYLTAVGTSMAESFSQEAEDKLSKMQFEKILQDSLQKVYNDFKEQQLDYFRDFARLADDFLANKESERKAKQDAQFKEVPLNEPKDKSSGDGASNPYLSQAKENISSTLDEKDFLSER